MAQALVPRNPKNYRVGIDGGLNSVGLAAIEFDTEGRPVAILQAVSFIHDSGVLEAKTATTRLSAAGVARRMRRLRRRRVKRLLALDRQFREWGWAEPTESNDPYAAWRARALLVRSFVVDESERQQLLIRALRHMARHRGWRNPYTRVGAFLSVNEPSQFFSDFRHRVEETTGERFGDDVTVAELAVAALDSGTGNALRMGRAGRSRPGKIRGEKPFSFLGGKLMQGDNANEIHAYARTQGLSEQLVRDLVTLVFAAESPRGSHVSRIGKDPLDGRPRAPKASDAFQRFRMASVLANVRLATADGYRPLSVAERTDAYALLSNTKPGEQLTWTDVGKLFGMSRGDLAGAASLDDDAEERLPLRPPIHVSDQSIRQAPKTLASVRDWWVTAGGEGRDALVALLVDGRHDETNPDSNAAWELLNGLSEDELGALDQLDLAAGRAAYSLQSLRKLTERMLTTEDDLHAARKAVFGVDDSWVPPSEPIGAPMGNPSVDRVTKIVARWLEAAESEWGSPAEVTIEHVREAFASAKTQRDRDNEMRRRFEENERQRLAIKAQEKLDARVTIEDVRRFDALTRQKGECAYCGDTITFATSEIDHIVPRKGVGSTNKRNNLVAVCVPCNRSKGNLPFAVWAERSSRTGVSVEAALARTRHWTRDRGASSKTWSIFLKDVRERLERTEADPEIDGRSMESVAWMANELRDRIAAHFRDTGTRVWVYQGAVTSDARRAAGIAERLPFIGGGDKTRLDRRHHAVDAAVVTLLDGSIAKTLAERRDLRTMQRFQRSDPSGPDWRDHLGSSPAAQQRFADWKRNMHTLADLLTNAFNDDRVVVTENIRLRLGNGRVHDDTVRPFTVHKAVGDAFTRDEIDAASTPAMWTALARDPDFDPVGGLPANPSRTIRIHGTHFGPSDELELFDKPRAAIAVRGGWAELGDSIHHARIYRWEERGKAKYGMLRVFAVDLHKHRDEDLFSVEPEPSWVSMRVAHPSIGRAGFSDKDYLGWLVPGDELLLDMSELLTGHVGRASESLGLEERQRWKIAGFMHPTKISLVPLMLAREGLERYIEIDPSREPFRESLEYVFNRWVSAVDVLFGKGRPVVIRRDALGRPRLESKANLPTCWYAR